VQKWIKEWDWRNLFQFIVEHMLLKKQEPTSYHQLSILLSLIGSDRLG